MRRSREWCLEHTPGGRLRSVMPSMQFVILEGVFQLRKTRPAEKVSVSNLANLLHPIDDALMTRPGRWNFYRDKDGNLYSGVFEEDIEHLDQRGYLVVEENGNIVPTRRADLAYRQVYQKPPEQRNWKRKPISLKNLDYPYWI